MKGDVGTLPKNRYSFKPTGIYKKKRELGSRFWEFVRKPKSRLDLNAI